MALQPIGITASQPAYNVGARSSLRIALAEAISYASVLDNVNPYDGKYRASGHEAARSGYKAVPIANSIEATI